MTLSQEIRGYDLKGMPQHCFEKYGWTPDFLQAMTPYAFAELFVIVESGEPTIVELGASAAAVKRTNEKLAEKGLKPISPSWFLEGLKPKR